MLFDAVIELKLSELKKAWEKERGTVHCFISFKVEAMPVCLYVDETGPVE